MPAMMPTAELAQNIRVGLALDFTEEGWPSMDLVGMTLLKKLQEIGRPKIQASCVRPPFKRAITRIPWLDRRPALINADRALNRLWFYPRFVSRLADQFDIFHIVDHSYSQLVNHLPADRSVVTCHDLDTFACLLTPDLQRRSSAFRLMTRRILKGFRRAARIICVSNWTREQILKHKLVPAERLAVVPEGVSSTFSMVGEPTADAEASRLLAHCGSAKTYVLHVGSTVPRKGIDVLLRAFSIVRSEFPTAHLLRVGGNFTDAQLQLVRSGHLESSVTVLPFLSSEVLAAIYRRAALTLLPSVAEGFGLPVLESLASGTPTLVSDLPPLREIGGSTAEYCPIGDVEAWARATVSLLTERELYSREWNERRQAGARHAARFTWERTTEETIRVYESLKAVR
jgi:glycosyltransferase involved in cell wall biosynthesis